MTNEHHSGCGGTISRPNLKCSTCGATGYGSGTCSGCGQTVSGSFSHGSVTCGTYNLISTTYRCSGCGSFSDSSGTHTENYTYYTCNSCGTSYSSTGTCTKSTPYTYYSINCGKTAGSKSYTRTITTYKCNTCNKSFVYKPAANSGSCAYCGSSHSAAVSGSTTGTHNAVTKYLIFAYK